MEKRKKGKVSKTENGTVEVEKKSMKMGLVLPLILILAVVGSVIGTVVTTKFLLPPTTGVQVAEKEEGKPTVSEDQTIVPLDEFVVNLAKSDGNQQYIRVNLSVLIEEKNSEDFAKNVALVRDSVVNVLRQKKASDILDTPEGLAQWKTELKETINNAYGVEIASDVYITDLAIQ
ncbi:flagellar basal body-associated protein FliL [Enterococcus saccharolyticus]|uniref:flagellar basal body-associated FliL family protein n=1 Tax=Enterococcus saccharolyticus TaxID=41997 RepID=UPI0039DF7F74